MLVQGKKYKVYISKENFLQTINNKLRLPAKDKMVGPFSIKNCEWVTGKIGSDSFALSDYRFSKIGIKICGKIKGNENNIEVSTSIYFMARIIITQLLFLFWFLFLFYLADNTFSRIAVLLTLVIGEIGNYLIVSSIIKNFYIFFEGLFRNENFISIEE
jgi:hypothetical protein